MIDESDIEELPDDMSKHLDEFCSQYDHGSDASTCSISPFIKGVEAALADEKGEQGDGGPNPFRGDRNKSDAWMRGYYRTLNLIKAEKLNPKGQGQA